MIYLLLAIICASLISIVMRLSTDKAKNKLSMLAVNYAVCLVLAAGFAGVSSMLPAVDGLGRALALGLFNGFVYLMAFVLMQQSVKTNGVVLSTTFSKLGLLVPIFISLTLFGEVPTPVQILGIITALAAIILISPEGKEQKSKFAGLIILLIITGSAEAMNKVYNELGTASLSSHFLLYTFFSALVISILFVVFRKEKPGIHELVFGVLLGVPNYFSARFALRALSFLPAVIVYPTISVATILVVSLTGLLAFNEKLSKRQCFALLIILAALTLLNI